MPSAANLFAAIFFSAVGFAAFIYGKKTVNWKPIVLGIALMAYPYFIEQTWLLYAMGSALCAALYYWRN